MRTTLGLALVGMLCMGCGKDGNPASACEPGATQACWGPGACKGGQSCLEDGSGWGACDCGTQPATGDPGNNGVFSSDCGVYMLTDLSVTGSSPEDTVAKFFAQSGSKLGDFVNELQPMEEPKIGIGYNPDTGAYDFSQLRYQQMRNGLKVYGGTVRLLVAEKDSFPIVLVNSTALNMGDYRPSFGGRVVDEANAAEILETIEADIDLAAIGEAASGMPNSLLGQRELVVWAGDIASCEAPTLAIAFTATTADGSAPSAMVVAANAGEVVYRKTLTASEAIGGTVSANVVPRPPDTCQELSLEARPLPWTNVVVSAGGSESTTVTTNALGAFTWSGVRGDQLSVQVAYDGQYFWVGDSPYVVSPSKSAPPPPVVVTGQLVELVLNGSVTVDPQETDRANAYYHANTARNWAIEAGRSWTAPNVVIDIEPNYNGHLPNGAACPNAYSSWDGVTGRRHLAFCNSVTIDNFVRRMTTADIVYHEYAHQLPWLVHGASTTYAYDEGIADSVSVTVARRGALKLCGLGSSARPPNPANCFYSASPSSCCTPEEMTKFSDAPDHRYGCGTSLASTLFELQRTLAPDQPTNAVGFRDYFLMDTIRSWAPAGSLPLGFISELPTLILKRYPTREEEICKVFEQRKWLGTDTSKSCCTKPNMKWDPNLPDRKDPKCVCVDGIDQVPNTKPIQCCTPEKPRWDTNSKSCAQACTGGSTWNATTNSCECPAGQTWNGTTCIAPQSKAFYGTSSGCATCVSGADCVAGLETCTTATPTPMALLFDASGKVTYVGPGIAPIVDSTRSGSTFTVVTTDLTKVSRMTLTGTIDETKSPATITGTIDGTADYRPMLDMVMKQTGPFALTQVIEPVCDKACPVLASVGCAEWKAEECGGSCALAIAMVGSTCHDQAAAVFECQSQQTKESFECTSSGVSMKSGVCESESAASKACAN